MKNNKIQCDECGELFVQTRVDKHLCSGRCKSLHFRRMQKEKLERFDRL